MTVTLRTGHRKMGKKTLNLCNSEINIFYVPKNVLNVLIGSFCCLNIVSKGFPLVIDRNRCYNRNRNRTETIFIKFEPKPEQEPKPEPKMD